MDPKDIAAVREAIEAPDEMSNGEACNHAALLMFAYHHVLPFDSTLKQRNEELAQLEIEKMEAQVRIQRIKEEIDRTNAKCRELEDKREKHIASEVQKRVERVEREAKQRVEDRKAELRLEREMKEELADQRKRNDEYQEQMDNLQKQLDKLSKAKTERQAAHDKNMEGFRVEVEELKGKRKHGE